MAQTRFILWWRQVNWVNMASWVLHVWFGSKDDVKYWLIEEYTFHFIKSSSPEDRPLSVSFSWERVFKCCDVIFQDQFFSDNDRISTTTYFPKLISRCKRDGGLAHSSQCKLTRQSTLAQQPLGLYIKWHHSVSLASWRIASVGYILHFYSVCHSVHAFKFLHPCGDILCCFLCPCT